MRAEAPLVGDRCAGCGGAFAPLLTERHIAGVLKTAIDAHGPIEVSNRGHAAKRIYAELKVLRRAGHEACSGDGRP